MRILPRYEAHYRSFSTVAPLSRAVRVMLYAGERDSPTTPTPGTDVIIMSYRRARPAAVCTPTKAATEPPAWRRRSAAAIHLAIHGIRISTDRQTD